MTEKTPLTIPGLRKMIRLMFCWVTKMGLSSWDPFKTLIDRQEKDGCTDDNISTNKSFFIRYSFSTMTPIIKNLAKFWCTNNPSYKSPLTWDFRFDLGKNLSYYALVLTYWNTTLLSKITKKSSVMLGPILICHK